jgi:hypothetical protein
MQTIIFDYLPPHATGTARMIRNVLAGRLRLAENSAQQGGDGPPTALRMVGTDLNDLGVVAYQVITSCLGA